MPVKAQVFETCASTNSAKGPRAPISNDIWGRCKEILDLVVATGVVWSIGVARALRVCVIVFSGVVGTVAIRLVGFAGGSPGGSW